MDEQKQRIAIAEACGWRCISPSNFKLGNKAWRRVEWKGGGMSFLQLPDYLNDLNAMHEAERTMSYEQKKKFLHILSDITNPQITTGVPYALMAPSQVSMLIHAAAPQRAEAFLKTIGKWEDE